MPKASVENPIFDLSPNFDGPIRQTLFSMVKRPLSLLLRLDRLNQMYAQIIADGGDSSLPAFLDLTLKQFGVDFFISDEDLARFPASGPVLVTANHPFGAIEGVMLGHILTRVRPDAKIMANYLLHHIPEMRPLFINVDPFERKDSAGKNISGLKESMRWLKDGHMLGVFPAGEVASLRLKKRMVTDKRWSPTVAGIARKTGAQVAPVFFSGRNGALFHLMGLIHPRLRTMLLPHANIKQADRTVKAAVGSPISPEKLASFESDEERTNYMRFRTYLLKTREAKERSSRFSLKQMRHAPIADPIPREVLRAEIEALPEDHILARHGAFTVFEADSRRIPNMIQEIGRVREVTFRAAGEGTGRPRDLDPFDDYYRHLVLWDEKEGEIAGGYRVGLCDKILAEHGPKGLYSTSLFRIREELLHQIQPALELGRSFITKEHQKSYMPLVLLWKGISAFVVRYQTYRTLFGCVSVSNEYSGISRELIVSFLTKHRLLPGLASMVKPRTPPKMKQIKRIDMTLPEAAFHDPEDMAHFIGDIEKGKGVPPLLKHYLKLGGRLLAFNVDPDFGYCIDGLILVDLLNTDPKILGRFMGKEEARDFQAMHRRLVDEAQGGRTRPAA